MPASPSLLLTLVVALIVALCATSTITTVSALNVNCYMGKIEFYDTSVTPNKLVASSDDLLYPFAVPILSMTTASKSPDGEARFVFFDELGVSNANVTTYVNGVQTHFDTLDDAPGLTVPIHGLPTHCPQTMTATFWIEQRTDTNPGHDKCDYNWTFVLTSPGVCGDPQFAGLRGQSYQVHGIDGAAYALISAPAYSLNARFDFLDGPRPCAIMPSTGVRSAACWTHPGSYLGAVGLKTQSGETLLLEAGAAASGFSLITLNSDSTLKPGQRVNLADALGSVEVLSTHEVRLTIGAFEIELESNDAFINLRAVRVAPTQWKSLAQQRVHGLLGQTWQLRRYLGAVKEIEGEVDDYVVEGNDVLGHRFVFSRFQEMAVASSKSA